MSTNVCKGIFVEKAYKSFDTHAEQQYHNDAVVSSDAFMEMMSGKCECSSST